MTDQPTPELAPPPIHVALVRVKDTAGAVAKRDRNDDQGFSFRGIDAVVNAVAPALIAHGVLVTPSLRKITYGTAETRRGSTMTVVRVVVRYRFTGPAGDHHDVLVPGESFDSGDKATAKAMSVAYRTALIQALSLPTDERDPDADSHELAAPVQREQPRRRRGQKQPEQPRLEAPPTEKTTEWVAAMLAAVQQHPRGSDGREDSLRAVWADALTYNIADLWLSVPEAWAVAAPEPQMKVGALIGLARSLPQPKQAGQ